MASALLIALAITASAAPARPVAPHDPTTPVAPTPVAPAPAPAAVPSGAEKSPPAAPEPAAPPASVRGAEHPAPQATQDAKASEAAGTTEKDDTRPPTVPPSLTKKAFEDEVRQAVRLRRTQRSQAEEERARLEKLASDIAAARTALKEETARLEQLAKRSPPRPASTPESVDKGSIENLARTLKGMRPEQAAAVLARLDKRLAAELLRRLRPANAAAIAEKLKPETAAELFSLVARAGAEESR